ncbi:MAG: DNA double-strand break repair nuclease NurA [Dehalococcoidales bacterium]|nr:MAG: DNA double-strand break repair nuclease NurA [Dehalococcoidales bacterium]
MALDLSKIVTQVAAMAARLRASSRERRERLEHALAVLTSQDDIGRLREKINASRTTWLVAGLVDGLDKCYPAPPVPADFTVIASDGSHIDVDRHRSTRCYLINIGSVTLHYGTNPGAVLDSLPRLYAGDEDLVIAAPGQRGREQPIEGALLGIKRGVDECRHLVELAVAVPANNPTLALLDGSLILWNLEAYADFVAEELLDNGFLTCLEELSKLGQEKRLTLASYISFPRSTDVINTLRVAVCPRETVDSDRCPACETRECDSLAGVRDRELFTSLLEPGERSSLFISSSKIQQRYGAHQVHFFYLRVDAEVARIEIPQWVAADEDLLSLTHTLVLDQCQRGHGYPVSLSEAHEKAVVTGADAENFWRLVEASLVEEHLPVTGSAKNRSKRTRWV